MNQSDSRALAAALVERGYTFVSDPSEADLVVLNTCVVRRSAEEKALARLRDLASLRRRRPELKTALMGCLVGIHPSPDLAERFPFIDIFLPPSQIDPLLRWLDGQSETRPGEDEGTSSCSAVVRPRGLSGDVTVYVPAVLGCSQACTYCVIPYRRGRERSRPLNVLLEEVRAAVSRGAREIVFLGQIIDRYGADLPEGPDLAQLLERTTQISGIERIRFLTSHPAFLTDRIIRTVADHAAICPVFELPVQAGHDDVLRAMRRGYTVDDYRRRIDLIRAHVPDAALHTDVIVGFPGETPEQFEGTARLLEEIRFAKVHVAKYSPRPQTYAARRLSDDVPEEEKERRRQRIEQIQREIQARRNAELLGQWVTVLVDGRDDRRGRWRGRTRDDRIVFFTGDAPSLGSLIDVKIEWTGPYSLIGSAASPSVGVA